MRVSFHALAVALILVLSGCVGDGSGSSQGPSTPVEALPAEVDSSTGGIEGTVTDDSVNPLPGAHVGLIAAEFATEFLTASDEAGRFSLSKVPPGTHKFAVSRLGYQDIARAVEVVAGEVTHLNVQLVALAIQETYHTILRGDGRVGCGVAVKPGTAVAVCGATYGSPLDSLDQFRVDFKLTAQDTSTIEMLVFETEWKSNQVLSSGFDVYWENAQDWGTGTTYTEEVRRFARVFGRSPLNTSADHDAIKAVAKKKPDLKYCTWTGPCKIYARVFPYASTLGNPTVDLSVYIDQRYTHWVTEFYGEPAPEGFSALADK